MHDRRSLFGDSLSLQMIDMGPVVYGQWESFDVTVNFNTAATGTVQVTKNGLVLGTMTGQATTISTSVAQQVYLNVLDAWESGDH